MSEVDSSPIVRFVCQADGHGDCGVAALAMCLGKSYQEALVAIARVERNVLKSGVNWRQLRAAAKALGTTLVEIRKFSLDDDSDDDGILNVALADGTAHAVYFAHGLIFDGRTNAAWKPDVYLAVHQGTTTSMLVRK